MTVPHMSTALRRGDYLQIAAERMAVDDIAASEGYARVEWVELIADPVFLKPISRPEVEREIAVVFCHGLPGPVMLPEGDQWTLGEVDGERARWDEAHPWWPTEHNLVFASSSLAAGPHFLRSRIEGPALLEQAARSVPTQPQPRAAAFNKPARALMVGDYLQTHAVRHPAWDMQIDEGFHRVEWVGHLAGAALAAVLNDPGWARGRLTLASVHGLSGMLLLPDAPVTVLTQPNPERRRWDEDTAWHSLPHYELAGATEPDLAEQQRIDSELRPPPTRSEEQLYPSRFSTPDKRALHLHGVDAIRPVAASQLPWPHGLFKCPYADRATHLAATYPKGHGTTAHAELFTQLRKDDFAACPYHQADDWGAIADAVLAFAAAQRDSGDEPVDRSAYAAPLSDRDRGWFRSLINGRIRWDTGAQHLTDGQHRLCALRAADVTVVPVHGRHLPDHDETEPAVDARTHARRTVADYWNNRATALFGPGRHSRLLTRLLIRYPRLRALLPKDE